MARRLKTTVGTLVIILLAAFLFGNDIIRTLRLYSRHTTYVTPTGAKLPSFFAGLKANAKIAEWARHPPPLPPAHTCGKKRGERLSLRCNASTYLPSDSTRASFCF